MRPLVDGGDAVRDCVFFAAPGDGVELAMSCRKITLSCPFTPVAMGPGYTHVTLTPVFAISLLKEFKNAAYALFAAAYTDWPGAGTLLAALHTPTILGANPRREASERAIRFATSFVSDIAPMALSWKSMRSTSSESPASALHA
tara:strand:+ start:192 stop:623 length:432 start_codon:yes stop_codon:yes gene_type:complete